MPPKPSTTRKAETKKKEKKVEDATFGLKNKTKSKKVQQFIKSVRTQIHGTGKKGTADPAEARKLKKEMEKARQAELLKLFRPAETEKERKAREEAEAKRREERGGEDSSDEESDSGSDYDSEEEETTLEMIVDAERAKIENGTPMTEELYLKWKEARLKQIAAEQAEAEAAKKKKGASGRELFLRDASLFVDDAEAVDKYEKAEEGGLEDEDGEAADADALADVEMDVDESLFEAESALEGLQLHESLPASFDDWKDATRMPKSMLLEYLQKIRAGGPKYEREQHGQEFLVTVILPEGFDKREFPAPKAYGSAKTAEHAASLVALHYLYCTRGTLEEVDVDAS